MLFGVLGMYDVELMYFCMVWFVLRGVRTSTLAFVWRSLLVHPHWDPFEPRNGRRIGFSDDRAGSLANQTIAHAPPFPNGYTRAFAEAVLSPRATTHTHRPTRAKRIGRPLPFPLCCALMPSLLCFASASRLLECVLSCTERSLYFVRRCHMSSSTES